MTYSTKLEHYSREAVPHVGGRVELDEWKDSSELFVCSDWDDADWRITSAIRGLYPAVNIDLTGRTVYLMSSNWMKTRIRVTFVGDGEPDTKAHGWLYFNPNRDMSQDLNADRVPAGLRDAVLLNKAARLAWDKAEAAKDNALALNALYRTLKDQREQFVSTKLDNVIHGLTVAIITIEKEISDLWEQHRVSHIEARELSKEARWV